MIKKLLGLIMVLSISGCTNLNTKKDNVSEDFIMNEDLDNIINEIIKINRDLKSLKIEIFDEEEIESNPTILAFFLDSYIEKCDSVKGIYNYKGIEIILNDLSYKRDFDKLITLTKKSFDKVECDSLLEKNKIYFGRDYISYPYRFSDDNNIEYVNGSSLNYKDRNIELTNYGKHEDIR
ncbi:MULTISPECIES: hypothetical protein [unclassified Flavobacterium]|uniref:hypothetical protein n=1 Tax=unclassified Flavobacterium TaxID=196869 RepID=UPI0013D1C25A|nr:MULTISPECIES: hypothetical protein [unclassified Flavobacterium]MBA5792379.1 hypothetical protein [Flavobacterium sp. xlx-221]